MNITTTKQLRQRPIYSVRPMSIFYPDPDTNKQPHLFELKVARTDAALEYKERKLTKSQGSKGHQKCKEPALEDRSNGWDNGSEASVFHLYHYTYTAWWLFWHGFCDGQSDETTSLLKASNSGKAVFKSRPYKGYHIQEQYSHLYPEVVDPKDVNQYFLLTFEKVEEWAWHFVSFLKSENTLLDSGLIFCLLLF